MLLRLNRAKEHAVSAFIAKNSANCANHSNRSKLDEFMMKPTLSLFCLPSLKTWRCGRLEFEVVT